MNRLIFLELICSHEKFMNFLSNYTNPVGLTQFSMVYKMEITTKNLNAERLSHRIIIFIEINVKH